VNLVLRPLLKFAGKGNRQVAAVFAFSPSACHKAVAYLSQRQPDVPIWLFSTARPMPETVVWCDRVETRRTAVALLLSAEFALWPRRVVFCVGTWTGESGHWLLKLAPFAIPPFRALLLNNNGDFFPGHLRAIGLHCTRRMRDYLHSLWNRARDILAACALLAVSTLLRWFRYPQRRLFHQRHGNQPLRVITIQDHTIPDHTGAGVMRYEQIGTGWQGESFRRLVEATDARWILWRGEGSEDDSIDDMLPLFDDERTFAVSRQVHFRGWKSVLFATAPFRKLQAGEATRLLAPLSGTILVSRQKLALLGTPKCGLATTAWLLLFWKAAAAGWRSYAIGGNSKVSAEPEFPVQETAFTLRVLSNNALRMLGPCEPELSRGNISFKTRTSASRARRSDRLRVLVVSPFLPYPLSHGGAVRIFNLCRALSGHVDFGLVAIREAHDAVDYSKLHEVFQDVWIVDPDEPGATDVRLPDQVRRYNSRSLRALVADLCRNWMPDLLQIEYTQLAGLLEHASGVPAILVEHDLTLALYRQLAEFEPSEAAEQEYARWLSFERQWLKAYEGVWAVSEEERQAAIRHGSPGDRTFTVPNGVDTVRFRPCLESVSQAEILYVGSFRHLPNVLACETLCGETMPRVWATSPNATLRVVAGPNHATFRQMLRHTLAPQLDERIEILGFIEDLRPLYAQASVVVVPLVVSSGTNIKVLEAMACGKPIVSTPRGCAGLGLRDGYDILIREDNLDFARTTCELLRDGSLRSQLGSNARRTAQDRFDWEAIARHAYRSYLTVLDRNEKTTNGPGGHKVVVG
jgi:glycosyltransferase involved in cell wall biosynthesis